MTGGQYTVGGGQGGVATTTGGGNNTGNPNEMSTDQPARAEVANPAIPTPATKPNRCFVFMHGSTADRRDASKHAH